jgi:hypothetical protein
VRVLEVNRVNNLTIERAIKRARICFLLHSRNNHIKSVRASIGQIMGTHKPTRERAQS